MGNVLDTIPGMGTERSWPVVFPSTELLLQHAVHTERDATDRLGHIIPRLLLRSCFFTQAQSTPRVIRNLKLNQSLETLEEEHDIKLSSYSLFIILSTLVKWGTSRL